MRLWRRVAAGLVLLSALPVARGAAENVPAPQAGSDTKTPTIKVFTRETVVDVTVTDNKGHAVHGLTREDFTVSENDKPQPIRSFREFGAGPPAPVRIMPHLPQGVYTNYQSVPGAGPVDVLLIDGLNSDFNDIANTQQAVLQYLRTMKPGTQMAIFWLSLSGLHLLQGFTADPALLFHAMNAQRYDLGANIEQYTRQWDTIEAFKQLALYLTAVKGRKNLLWFTAGMPIMLTRDGGYEWGDPGIDMGTVHRLMDAYEMLTNEEVAVYPISPRGPGPMGGVQLRAEEVAEQTGGMALYNNNDIAGLIGKAVEHGAHFYTLSYVPPDRKDDGHYHTIHITVNRPGVTLVYRRGYNAEDVVQHAPTEGPQLLKASMEGNSPPTTQVLFDARVTPAAAETPAEAAGISKAATDAGKVTTGKKKDGKDPVTFDVLYLVPQSQITFEDAEGGVHRGGLEFDVAAYDNMRRRVALLSQKIRLPLTEEEYANFIRKPFMFSQRLELPRGQITLRVGVLDSVSNKVGTLEIPLMVTGAMGVTVRPVVTGCPPRCSLKGKLDEAAQEIQPEQKTPQPQQQPAAGGAEAQPADAKGTTATQP